MKTVQEIVVQLDNKPGALSRITELLGSDGVGILGLTVKGGSDPGHVHFVATNPPRALKILESAGLAPTVREVIAAELPNHPGGFHTLLKTLGQAGVNVEYLYACMACEGAVTNAVLLLSVDDSEKAGEALAREWIRVLGEELYTY